MIWNLKKFFCKGIVLREYPTRDSSFRSEDSLESWLEKWGVVGLTGVDTRSLTRNIGKKGVRNVMLHFAEKGEVVSAVNLIQELRDYPTLLGQDLTLAISTPEPYKWDEGFIGIGNGAKKLILKGSTTSLFLIMVPNLTYFVVWQRVILAVTVIPGYSS